jgi:hypothetical protein
MSNRVIAFPIDRRVSERRRMEMFAAFFNRYVAEDIGVFSIPHMPGLWRAVQNNGQHPWKHLWLIERVR